LAPVLNYDSAAMRDILGIGITGRTLTDLERRIIRDSSPYAIVLFGRNIESDEQLRELVRECKSIASTPPLMMIDQEGGRVDRLRNLIPGIPSAEAFGEGEQPDAMSEWTGKLIGRALRYFDIEIDLAPVVDVRARDYSPKGLERRTFSDEPERVIELAGAFMRGLHGAGVASCLKHFPGIGRGSADPHYGATVIDVPGAELEARDLVPFAKLGNAAGAIMIGHGTYPQIDEPDVPATLSRRITTDLLRGPAGFDGVAITDDMEMHAVSDLGAYEEISDRALMAGNDVILYCSHIERIPDLQRYLADKAKRDAAFGARFDDAVRRAEAYRAHCERLRAEGSPPAESFDALLDEAIDFVSAFEKTRPPYDDYVGSDRRKNNRSPGTGKTGREEWT
jgi:beta-N-acetylhexosaminidase